MIGLGKMSEAELKELHGFAIHNRYSCFQPTHVGSKENICGCFHCLAIFPASEIKEFIDMTETAMCPKCGIDSVLPGGRGTLEVLKEMQQYYFAPEVL